MSIFGYVFRAQENTTISVAIVNMDTPPSGQASLALPIIANLRADAKNLLVSEMAEADAREAVQAGTQKVALIFPSTFTQDLKSAQHRTSVEVAVEGSNPSQAGSALNVVGQALLKSAPEVYRSLVPPAMAGIVPSSLPLEIKPTRLYGGDNLKMLDFFAPMFIAYIGFFLIFLLTSVSFLRERTQGTMERLSASPVTRIELVLGYMLGFGFFAMIQATVMLLFTVYVLQVQYAGNLLSIFVVSSVLVLVAVNLGIFLSAFAKNELQAIQFIPIVILPQVLLSGLLWPVQEMPTWLQTVARAMPLTYAIDALTDIMIRGKSLAATWLPLLVLLAFATVAAVLAANSVRREVA
jgi:ABC-2 type transport system permease protein